MSNFLTGPQIKTQKLRFFSLFFFGLCVEIRFAYAFFNELAT